MPFALFKNDLKLILRKKTILVLIIVLQVLVIGILSSVFENLLGNTQDEQSEFRCGYSVSENCRYESADGIIKNSLEQSGATLVECGSMEAQEVISGKIADVFVEITDSGCKIYSADETKAQASIAKYTMAMFFQSYTDSVELAENGIDPSIAASAARTESVKIDITPVPSSIDYYGIIYIVYFIWLCPLVLAFVTASERKNNINKRFLASPVSGLGLYLGKLSACFCADCVITLLSVSINTAIYGISWGNYLGTAGIILLLVLASSAFGIMIIELTRNIAASFAIYFCFIQFWGLVGGSFESYIYMTITGFGWKYSPIYYVNRTIVEYSTMGHSDCTLICVAVLLGILFVSTLGGALLVRKRTGESA